jgi:type II secretory pathway pseudopilin PulG
VVSVVGTLLALLVFFALFGIFLTSYVPLWMTDNEAEFTNQAQASFANLQENMNEQAALGTAPLLSTPISMASQGIPLIAQPTSGILNFVPKTPGVFGNVSMSVGPGGGRAYSVNDSFGILRMTLANRYYAPELFELEDDAVIQSQGDLHQIVVFPPPLSFNVSGSDVGVTIGLFQLIGNATQAVSTGTLLVYTHFLTTQTYYSNGAGGHPFNSTFRIGTHYACAWQAYLNETIHGADLPTGLASLTPTKCLASQTTAQNVVLKLTGISSIQLIVASFQVVIGVGVE